MTQNMKVQLTQLEDCLPNELSSLPKSVLALFTHLASYRDHPVSLHNTETQILQLSHCLTYQNNKTQLCQVKDNSKPSYNL